MHICQLFIQILILLAYWVLERLWARIRSFNNPGHRQIHYPVCWSILLLFLTWWKVGTYYFAYPVAILAALGLLLATFQRLQNGEFLYSRFWRSYWRLTCLISFAALVFANLLPPLPTA